MLRVPVNVPKEEPRSLDQAHAAGADVRPIASPIEALQIAVANPHRQVVFFAAGFETTTAPVASLLVQGIPDNLSLLLSGRLTWPAVAMLLDSDTPGFDALVAPGHVATVMGPEEWKFVIARHRIPAAVAGFTAESLLAATYSVLRQLLDERLFLDNCYPELVRPGGNPMARQHLQTAMDVTDANWRGIGTIPEFRLPAQPKLSSMGCPRAFSRLRRRDPAPGGRDAARLRLRSGGAGTQLPQPVPHLRQGLHPAQPGGTLYGFGRRGLQNLVECRHQSLMLILPKTNSSG